MPIPRKITAKLNSGISPTFISRVISRNGPFHPKKVPHDRFRSKCHRRNPFAKLETSGVGSGPTSMQTTACFPAAGFFLFSSSPVAVHVL